MDVIDLPGRDPHANLAYEEALFHRLRDDPRPTLLFYLNSPCVVLGRSNKTDEWVDEAALAADHVPLLRRFSGGGAVYHDEHNLNFSFLLPRKMLDDLVGATLGRPSSSRDDALHRPPGNASTVPGFNTADAAKQPPYKSCGPRDYIAFFRNLVIRAMQQAAPGNYALAGVSDITLNGRKISGNAQRIASSLVLHHGTLLLRCPLAAIERYLRVPPNRPSVPHREFVTGLWEEGLETSADELKDAFQPSFREALESL